MVLAPDKSLSYPHALSAEKMLNNPSLESNVIFDCGASGAM